MPWFLASWLVLTLKNDASFLHYPAMASLTRLAYLLKAFEAALNGR